MRLKSRHDLRRLRRMPTPAPPQIPDLTLLRRIGSGSYGDVWIARTVTGVYRAVKVVEPRFPTTTKDLYRAPTL